MFKNALSSFKPAAQYLYKDKLNFMLALIPILIGMLLYYFLGSWIYGSTMEQGQMLIKQYVSEGTLGSLVYYIVAAILTIMLYFLINWTFVLLVSMLASPFNDMLSARIEKKVQGKKTDDLTTSFKNMINKFVKTMVNEIKKISFIIFLSLLSLLLGFFPFLTPLSVFISILLLSIEFLDYNWSRHNLSFAFCFRDLRRHMLGYALGGAFFFIIVSVPVVNLIVPAFATSFYTVLWMKNNEHSDQVTQ